MTKGIKQGNGKSAHPNSLLRGMATRLLHQPTGTCGGIQRWGNVAECSNQC